MIKIENHLGTIEISQEFIANLAGKAASECFGVVGMVNSTPSQGFRSLPVSYTHLDVYKRQEISRRKQHDAESKRHAWRSIQDCAGRIDRDAVNYNHRPLLTGGFLCPF